MYSSPQEVFDKVCEHLAQQKKKSINQETGNCYYLHPEDGTKCAIGCLLPDNILLDVSSRSEGQNVFDLCDRHEISNLFKFGAALTLLGLLQYCHDKAEDLHDLQHRLVQIGVDYNLDASKVQLIKEWS